MRACCRAGKTGRGLRWFTLALICLASFSLANATSSGAPMFAWADRNGMRLMAASAGELPADLNSYDRALCSGNQLVSVRFFRVQPQGPKDTGRQVSQNFDQQAGPVFRVERSTRLQPDDICLLAPSSYFVGKRLPELTRWRGPLLEQAPAPAKCSPQERARIPAKAGRPVVACFALAWWRGGKLLLAEYQRRPDNLLAVLTLDTPSGVFLAEFPTKAEWRVDDEGQLSPQSWVPLFITERDTRVELGIAWGGPEGNSLMLLRTRGALLDNVAATYLYWAPL